MGEDCVFCDFVEERVRHKNGYPFIPTYETRETVSFLSIDFPADEDGHLLVIPKDHYQNLEDIPAHILHELSEHVAKACAVTRETHDACNVLLNNGREAGQAVMHTHFHIVPRNTEDEIEIEVWEEKDMSQERFREVSEALQNRFQQV